MLMKKITVLFFCALPMLGFAQDRSFGQLYSAHLLEKGSLELEFWHTSRFGHEGQLYHGMDQRFKVEAGLGKRIQTALYFNRFQNTFSDASNDVVHSSQIGFSNEWKVGLSKPESSFSMAAYAEFSIRGNVLELESKFIADKKWNKNLLACNLSCRLDEVLLREYGETHLETESTPLELDLGFMHQFGSCVGLGMEVRNNNSVVHGHWENSVLYAGPTINYHQEHWFILANYLPQLANLHKTANYPGKKVLDVRERSEARIMIGFTL